MVFSQLDLITETNIYDTEHTFREAVRYIESACGGRKLENNFERQCTVGLKTQKFIIYSPIVIV